MWELAFFCVMIIAGITGCAFFVLQLRTVVDIRIERRLRQVPGEAGVAGAASLSQPSPAGLGALVSRLAERFAPEQSDASRLKKQLLQAGVYSPHALTLYCGAKVVLAAVGVIVGAAIVVLGVVPEYVGLLCGATLAGIGMLAPEMWLQWRCKYRRNLLRKSLPDFLDLLVACLESGASFQGALQRVTDELCVAHPLLAAELRLAQREIELGTPPAAAIRHFGDRSGQEGVRSLGTMIEQAQRFGTSLSVALRNHADLLRVKREQRAEELANRAAVKILIPTLVFIFPAIFIVMAGPAAIQIYEKLTQPQTGATASQR